MYVLDWGLAKLQAESSELAATETVTNPAAGTDGQTLHGAVMGTPGYMAPEQARGETTAIGAASDVYALGALLFEVLALEPLHAGDTTQALLASTLAGPDSRPSARAPQRNVAPELDAICVRALALDLSQRYGSVREMVADVERFLEGDRDLERRRLLSQAHIEPARAASATSSIRGRAEAIRELNRSLALEPSNAIALAELKRLLLTPPVETPPEAREMLDRSIDAERRTTAREGVASFAVWLALVPLLGLAGVRDWNTVIATAMAIAASALLALYLWKRKARVSNAAAFALLGVSSLSIVGLSFFLGPFVLIPGVAAQNTVVFAAHAPRGPLRFATIGVGIATVILPFVLEMAGLFPPSFVFRGGELVLLPRMLNLPAAPTLLLLSIGTVATVIVPCIVVSRLLDQVHAARARTFTHLWHMNQLVPEAATARGANGAR